MQAAKITGRSIETTDKIPAIAFDGVCCANDFAAFGVIRGLADYGIHVPQDVKVIGFRRRDFRNLRHPFAEHHPKWISTSLPNSRSI